MIHLGLDPGTSNPGLAVVQRVGQRWVLIDSPVLHSLDELTDELGKILKTVGPHDTASVAIERVSWAHGKDDRGHGHGSADILRAVGMSQLFAKLVGARFVEVAPVTWRKRIAGSGRASKDDVRRALRVICDGIPTVFGANRSDALAVAISGAMEVRR